LSKQKSSGAELARMVGTSPARGIEAVIKAQLISAVLKAVEKHGFTHASLAVKSGLPRSAVTGILSGSLQKVTTDRVLRLAYAAGLLVEIRVRDAY
jgi:predicted XRE-type DNA-binding protein